MEPLTPLDAAILTGLLLLYSLVFTRATTGDGEERYKEERESFKSDPESGKWLPPPGLYASVWLTLNFLVPFAFWMYTRTNKVMYNDTQWLFAVLAHAIYFTSNHFWNSAFDQWNVKYMRVITALSGVAMYVLVGCAAASVQRTKIIEAIFPLVVFVVTAAWLSFAFVISLQLSTKNSKGGFRHLSGAPAPPESATLTTAYDQITPPNSF
jgi:hypothetical protein